MEILEKLIIESGLPVGEDMNGEKLYPNDSVYFIGNKTNLVKIEYGNHPEKFGTGYISGYFIPYNCEKLK